MKDPVLATDITTVKAQNQADTAIFMFESPNPEKAFDYEMKLTNLDQEHLGIPETDYSVVIKMPSGELQWVIRDLSQLGKPVVISCTKEEDTIITEMQEPVTISFACRKLCDYEKENFKKMVDNVTDTGSHIVPRFQEPNNKKFGTAKDKMLAIEDRTDIKARLSIKWNEVRLSIKQNKVQVRIDERAKTRDDERVHTRVDKRDEMRDDKRAYARVNVRADPSDWDPGGGPVKPQDYCLVAWWG